MSKKKNEIIDEQSLINNLENSENNIIKENLDSIMSDRFGRYSKYIIQQRALPDVRDGLKPVQRRILYSMYELGLQHTKPYKKSARVVGDVIGKYHPHGDSSIYEAMVRMAQDWKMGITLLDMHGNVGSIDDDPAAAMRYTEIRLAKIADYVIGDLKKNTVKFAPNFDDSEKEPTVLPSLIPNLLVNGAKGIAAGFATEMPPHNLGEVLDAAIAKIKKPNMPILQLNKFILGPDFPTGGVIYGTKGIEESFETGKGKITLVSKYKFYEDENNKYIEIIEIPFGVIKSKLVHDIDTIVVNESISGLLEVKDQSDRKGISILITLDKNANEKVIVNYLLQKTEMQVYYNYNNVAIVDNSPKLLNLNQLLENYINHLKDVKTKVLIFDLEKAKLRLEIVLGFLKVAEITDEVIKVIRQSENGKQGVIENLISHFGFTENQAVAIAELRLYRLSKTDKEAFLLEKQDLENQIAHMELLLSNPEEFDKYLIQTLKDIKKEFAVPRKTTIEEESLRISYSEADLVKHENVIITVSKHGYFKRFSKKMEETNDLRVIGVKEDDKIIYYDNTATTNNLLVFTNLGNYAIIPVFKIEETKWKEYGVHLSDFVELSSGEELVSVINVTDFNILNYVCLFTKKGTGKRVVLNDFMVSRTSKTFVAINLKDGDELIGAKLSNGYKDVILVSSMGYAWRYSENEVQIYGTKSGGTNSCHLYPGDYLCGFVTAFGKETITLIFKDKFIKRIKFQDVPITTKKTVGIPIYLNSKNKPLHITDISVTRSSTKILVKNIDNETFLEKVSDYPISKVHEGVSKIKTPNVEYSTLKIFETTLSIDEEINNQTQTIEIDLSDLMNSKDDEIKTNVKLPKSPKSKKEKINPNEDNQTLELDDFETKLQQKREENANSTEKKTKINKYEKSNLTEEQIMRQAEAKLESVIDFDIDSILNKLNKKK
ncbi:DNA topoisomerase IV subunit A [Mycoplasmopsis hyopharyngis]|uniref:DNA topoisomerase IV subunit A n=1 Tax=Mycoplasmopsis hyopharyngis TaxID=29558 RepID=UPI003872CA93